MPIVTRPDGTSVDLNHWRDPTKGTTLNVMLRWRDQFVAAQTAWARNVQGADPATIDTYRAGLTQGYAAALADLRRHKVIP